MKLNCIPGIYFAKDGSISMGSYAAAGRFNWKKSKLAPSSCTTLAEIVNLPEEFVSNTPYFVVKDTDLITW